MKHKSGRYLFRNNVKASDASGLDSNGGKVEYPIKLMNVSFIEM